MVHVEEKKVIGLPLRTQNAPGKAEVDIPAHWYTFEKECLPNIPNKINSQVLGVYTDYEGDHTKPYTLIYGCEVSSFDTVPKGMITHTIPAGDYEEFRAEGELMSALYGTWELIWETCKNRAYASDFEVFELEGFDPSNVSVPILISVKS